MIQAHSHGLTPELQAVFTLAVVEKCKADQPSLKLDIDASLSLWKQRNHKYLAAARKSGEAEFNKALAAGRESYDQQGRFSEAYCQKLIVGLKTQELDIGQDE